MKIEKIVNIIEDVKNDNGDLDEAIRRLKKADLDQKTEKKKEKEDKEKDKKKKKAKKKKDKKKKKSVEAYEEDIRKLSKLSTDKIVDKLMHI